MKPCARACRPTSNRLDPRRVWPQSYGYRQLGRGTVGLIHGWPLSSALWAAQVPAVTQLMGG